MTVSSKCLPFKEDQGVCVCVCVCVCVGGGAGDERDEDKELIRKHGPTRMKVKYQNGEPLVMMILT